MGIGTGNGGKGGNSFGTGGISNPGIPTPEVQLELPENESEPSTVGPSAVLARLVDD